MQIFSDTNIASLFVISLFSAVDREEIKILHERLKQCVRKEGVNHPMACRDYKQAYTKAVEKYKSLSMSNNGVRL